MEGILRVTPEQLETAANEFSAKGTSLGNLTSRMMQLVEEMNRVWEGDAALSYMSRFRQLDKDIQRMIRMIREHAEDLNGMAAIYRNAEAHNQELAAGLAGNVIV